MQMTTEARLWLDGTVRGILARHPLGDAERAGMTYELMSHLHAAGEARAASAGRAEVTREDLEAALADAGGEAALAAAFVQPFARPIERVLFWRRFGAFLIDAVLLGIVISFAHGALVVTVGPIAAPLDTGEAGGIEEEYWAFLPWGFHDVRLPILLQALIAVTSGILTLGYFTWLEAKEGRSLGKRALDLRVMRVDGRPMTYRDALLRNLVKLAPLLLALDTLVMLLAFREEKQRLSDRLAETIVVRT